MLPEEVPLPLRVIVEKALEKDPADRFQSMRDMVVDLRRAARQTPEAAPALPMIRRSKRARSWPAAIATLIVLAAAIALFVSRTRQPAEPASHEYTQLTNFADLGIPMVPVVKQPAPTACVHCKAGQVPVCEGTKDDGTGALVPSGANVPCPPLSFLFGGKCPADGDGWDNASGPTGCNPVR